MFVSNIEIFLKKWKNKKHQNGRQRCENLPEHEKRKAAIIHKIFDTNADFHMK